MATAGSGDPLIARWLELSSLLDEALELSPDALAQWLVGVRARDAELADSLERLLATRDAEIGAVDGLATSARLAVDDPDDIADDEPRPGAMVGPYRLLRELGVGGMGSVWLAERDDGTLKRHVALKLPRFVWSGAFAERMRRERDIVGSLEHPLIARLYDAGADAAGRPYLAMEYVDGVPIDAWCRDRDASIRVRVGLLLQVAAAVGHAHARLVVHRDLKPANILVTADGSVRLLDFGIAKLMEGDRTEATALTRVSGRALTLDYASPEQIRGEPLGTASDVYSLGVVAYELLSGRRPYRLRRGTAAELEVAIESADPPLASDASGVAERRSALQGDLDAILNKTLKKQAVDRYESMAAWSADLQRWLDGLPVEARPDRLAYRARKFVARNRFQVAAGSVLALSLIAGTAVSLWQARTARSEAARAEEVKRFVLSIFSNADTAGGGNRTTTAPQLLDAARLRLERSPVDDPAVQAELLVSIGWALVGQGDAARAVPVLEEAREWAARSLRPESAVAIDAKLALAEAQLYLDHPKIALPLAEDAERAATASRDVARQGNAMRLQAWALQADDRLADATRKARQAVALLEGDPHADPRILLDAYDRLVSSLDLQRDPATLDAAAHAAAFARRINGDRDTASSLLTRAELASAQFRYGNANAQSYAELKSVWEAQRRLLGERHMNTQNTALMIEGMARSRGDVVTSITMLRGLLEAQEADPSGTWRSAAIYRLRYAQALLAAHRYGEASDTLAPVVARLAELPSDWRQLTLSVQALALARDGRLDLAAPLLASLLADKPVAEEPRANLNRERIAEALVAARRPGEARPLMDAVVESSARRNEKPSSSLARIDGTVWLAQGEPKKALPLLRSADELYASSHPDGSPERADAQMARAEAELAAGDAAAALAVSTQAESFWQAFDPKHPDAARALLWHARSLAAVGREEAAQRELVRARTLLREADRPVPAALSAELAAPLKPRSATGRAKG